MMRTGDNASSDELSISIALEVEKSSNEFRASWIAGRNPSIEDYLSRTPSSALRQKLYELLVVELQLRRGAGEAPSSADYESRFDEYRDVVESAFRPRTVPCDSLADTHTFDKSSVDSLDAPASRAGTYPSPRRLGAFRLDKLLGEGGFGQVWRAHDMKLDRDVAIKFPRPDKGLSVERVQLLLQEAKKAALFDGDGVVPIHEVGESDGIPYIVTAFMQGGALEDRLRNGDKWSPEEAAELIASLATALHRAHLKGLVHRDIKPGNILCDDRRRPFLADFGLATSEQEQLREDPGVVGTWTYMSPEQIRGESHRVDARSDIYSLGVVLYRLLTGRLPFLADTPAAYRDQILHREARPPRTINDGIPKELEAVCLKCLSKSISGRYTTADDLARDLRRWKSERTTTRTFRRVVAVAACLAIPPAAILFWSWRQPQTIQPSPQPSPQASLDPTPQQPLGGHVTPRAVLGTGTLDGSFFRVNEVTNTLNLVSDDMYLVGLGRIDQSDAVVRIRMKSRMENGEAGVFLAFREHETDGRHQMQRIRLQRRYDGIFCIRRILEKFHSDNPGTRHSDAFPEVTLEGAVEEGTFELRFTQGRLAKLYWNEKPIETIPAYSDDTQFANVTGLFGVYTSATAATFSRFTFNEQQQVFTTDPSRN